MMLDKQIQVVFLFEFKMDCKAAETTSNINNAFDPGTANEHIGQWWFKKFCRGESWRWTPQWPASGSWQQPVERIIETDPVTTTWEVAKELNVDHCIVIWHLKETGQVKKLNKWVSHELTTSQKNNFEVKPSLILCKNNEQFLHWIVTCNKKWILYDS